MKTDIETAGHTWQAALRDRLSGYIEKTKKRFPDNIVDFQDMLDEDSAQFYTSTQELEVFRLPHQDLYKLQVIYAAYEFLIDITESPYDVETNDLIIKARDYCPPAVIFGTEFPFRLRHDESQWFMWLAKEVFNIPKRVSFAFWHKRFFNTFHLMRFDDDVEHDDKDEADYYFDD